MSYSEFLLWIQTNTPDGTPSDDFIQYLAMIGATIIQRASENSNRTVSESLDSIAHQTIVNH